MKKRQILKNTSNVKIRTLNKKKIVTYSSSTVIGPFFIRHQLINNNYESRIR